MTTDARFNTSGSPQSPAVRIVSSTAGDMALSGPLIRFSLQASGIWSGGTFLIWWVGVALSSTSLTASVAALTLFIIWTGVCLNCLVGGVSRMMAHEMEYNSKASATQGWSFVRRRVLSLAFGPAVLALAVLIGIGLVRLLVYLVTLIPALGPLLGALLTLPIFLFVLAAGLFTFNLYMLPCVMGIEDHGAWRAARDLTRAIRTNPLTMTQSFLGVLLTLIPMAVFTGCIVVAALGVSYFMSGGTTDLTGMLMGEGSSGLALTTTIRLVSILTIVFVWSAFLIVFAALSFAMHYYNASRPAKRDSRAESARSAEHIATEQREGGYQGVQERLQE